jgi:hypothetical protein
MCDEKESLRLKGEAFGNGRDVRNIFEQTLRNLATRVAAGDSNLQEIVADDVPA